MVFKERVNMYLYSIYILHGAIECIVCLCSVLNSTLLYFTSKMRCFDRNVVAFFSGGVQKQDGMTLLCSIVILKTQPHEIFK